MDTPPEMKKLAKDSIKHASFGDRMFGWLGNLELWYGVMAFSVPVMSVAVANTGSDTYNFPMSYMKWMLMAVAGSGAMMGVVNRLMKRRDRIAAGKDVEGIE